MNRFLLLIVCVLASAGPSAKADVIYQSSILGPTGLAFDIPSPPEFWSGVSIHGASGVGVRFKIEDTVRVTSIGGHFILSPLSPFSEFLGGIVELDGPDDFPDSSDLTTNDVLGLATMVFPEPSDITKSDIDLLLEPGWYALAFRGIQGLAAAGGAMAFSTDIHNPDYLLYGPNFGWADDTVRDLTRWKNFHFFVEGQVVPEPHSYFAIFFIFVTAMTSRGLALAGGHRILTQTHKQNFAQGKA